MDTTSLAAAFGGRLLTSAQEMAPFLTDWRGKWQGHAVAVAQPQTVQGVAAIVQWCLRNNVAVVPQGGNTGLSGGATPGVGTASLVLSLVRLNCVRHVDPVNNTITVEAGATLLQVREAARLADRLFPLSLAAEGSCTIGGNLATNAGGVQVLRYGNARELCLGLEVVTPQGDVWHGLRGLRKDNTGYSLRDLFVGSEGTLGVITAATLRLFPRPAAQAAAFVAVESTTQAVRLLQIAQSALDASLTACELMSDTCMVLVEKHVSAVRFPFLQRSPWYVLLEVSDAESDERAEASIEAVLQAALEEGAAFDAVLARSGSQFDALWALRENISEAQAAEGPTIKHDISLPISAIPAFVECTIRAITHAFPNERLVVFGHLGDGNLHFNLSPAAMCDQSARVNFAALEPTINRLVHDAVVEHGGSISAEHGLGMLRRDEAARYKDTVELRLLRALKTSFDPRNLMNPGKALP